jgi:hypothetical protein
MMTRLCTAALLISLAAATDTAAETATLPATNVTTSAAATRPPIPASLDGYDAVMLLGGTTFIMMLFYMVNSHIDSIPRSTWSMLSAAVSIFCAVMTNNVINEIVMRWIGLENNDPPTAGNIVNLALQMVVYWLLVVILLFVFKVSVLRLKGYGTIGGHIMGFAAIGLWTQICSLNPFRTSAWWIFPVVFLMYLASMIVFLGLFHVAALGIRKNMDKDDQDRWHDQSQDTSTDFLCLGASFLLITWVKYLIFGDLEPAMTDPKVQHEVGDMWALGIVGVVFICFSILSTIIAHKVKGASAVTILSMVTTIMATCAAMCLHDVFNWRILPHAVSLVTGKLSVAFQLSVIAMALILVIAVAGKCGGSFEKLLRGMFTGLALAVGSSWEKTFDAAVDGLDAFGFSEGRKAVLTLLLVCLVFPAWMVYILPKGDPELRETIKSSPPVWAVCCDVDPCEEEGDEYDDEFD